MFVTTAIKPQRALRLITPGFFFLPIPFRPVTPPFPFLTSLSPRPLFLKVLILSLAGLAAAAAFSLEAGIV